MFTATEIHLQEQKLSVLCGELGSVHLRCFIFYLNAAIAAAAAAAATIHYYTFWNQMMKKCHPAINTFSLTVKVKHIKNDTAFVLWNHISCWWPQIGRDGYCLHLVWKSSSFSPIIAGLSSTCPQLVLWKNPPTSKASEKKPSSNLTVCKDAAGNLSSNRSFFFLL